MSRFNSHITPHNPTLWNHFLEGSVAAWGTLLEDNYRLLFNYGLRFGMDREGVHDCIHDLFLTLWDSRLRLNAHLDNVPFYLLRAFRHKLIKEKQKERTYQPLDDTATDQLREAPLEDWLTSQETAQLNDQRLKALLLTLPARQQEVLYLKFYANLSNQQVADVMHLQPQSVANLLHTALQRLRGQWGVNTGLVILVVLLREVLG